MSRIFQAQAPRSCKNQISTKSKHKPKENSKKRSDERERVLYISSPNRKKLEKCWTCEGFSNHRENRKRAKVRKAEKESVNQDAKKQILKNQGPASNP